MNCVARHVSKIFSQAMCHPLAPLKLKVLAWQLEIINNELKISFSEVEMEKIVLDLKFALVLKFTI